MKKIRLKTQLDCKQVNVQQLIPKLRIMKPGQRKFLQANVVIPSAPKRLNGVPSIHMSITTWKSQDGYVIQRNW